MSELKYPIKIKHYHTEKVYTLFRKEIDKNIHTHKSEKLEKNTACKKLNKIGLVATLILNKVNFKLKRFLKMKINTLQITNIN